MSDTSIQTAPKTQGLSARWALAVGAVGLVAAGAVAGGLLSQRTSAEAREAGLQPSAPVVQAAPAKRVVAPIACANCGVVESVRVESRKGPATGVGAVAGGVIGGVLGNQVGGGDGRKAMTVVGAVGGGLLGNEIEKNQRATTVYVADVRLDNGRLQTFTRSTPILQGQRVRVEGDGLHIVQS